MGILVEARLFATIKHGEQKYGKHPYSYHLQQVAAKVEDYYKDKLTDAELYHLITISWLHDVLEDTNTSMSEIEENFGVLVATAVRKLTKSHKQPYEEYIKQIREYPFAFKVKLCDTMCNLEQCIRDGDNRVRKYLKQLTLLTE